MRTLTRAAHAACALALATCAARAQSVTIESNAIGARLGWSASAAGDFNGDTYVDLAVGAPGYSSGAASEGAVFVYFGSATGIGTSPSKILVGGQSECGFGTSIACAGDVNGDARADLAVGAPLWDGGQADEGKVFVYLCLSASGVTLGWTAESDQAGARMGASVASSLPFGVVIPPPNGATRYPSFNGDQLGDIAVGSPGWDGGQVDEGRVQIFRGSSTGGTILLPAGSFESDQAGAQLGRALGGAGWMNNDAYADLAVGAMYWNVDGAPVGRVALHFGSGSGLQTSPSWQRFGPNAESFFGGTVATAGDVNNDGRWDLLVGSWSNIDTSGQRDEMGKAELFLGTDGVPSQTPSWTKVTDQADSRLGYSIGSAGRFNADLYFDVVIGEPLRDEGIGRAVVYYGSAAGLSTSQAWAASVSGTDPLAGFAVGTAGDVNKDTRWEVVVGAPMYFNGQADEGAFRLIKGGLVPNQNQGN